MKQIRLSNKELDVMMVFWSTDKTLAATDIPKYNTNLNVNTVQAVVKSLLKKKFIEVADIVYHGTVLTRQYTPTVTGEDYVLRQLEGNPRSVEIIEGLIEDMHDISTIEKIESIVQKRKNAIA